MPYPGGKAGPGVWQRIVSLFPPHRVYIEPFAGGGAVLVRKRPAELNIAVDLDVHALYQIGGDLTRRSRGFAMGSVAEDLPRLAERWGIPADGCDWAWRAGDRASIAGARTAIEDPVYYLLEGDGLELMERWPMAADHVVYCDPPYPRSVLRSRPRYRHMMTDDDHSHLLALLGRQPCRSFVSGYRCDLYDAALASWERIDYMTSTRGSGSVLESVWFMPSLGPLRMQYDQSGLNFREREKNRRWARNLIARMEDLPADRRRAILSAVFEHFQHYV